MFRNHLIWLIIWAAKIDKVLKLEQDSNRQPNGTGDSAGRTAFISRKENLDKFDIIRLRDSNPQK